MVGFNAGENEFAALGAFAHVGSNEQLAGETAGQRLEEKGIQRPICVVQGQGHVGLEARCAGVKELLPGPSWTATCCPPSAGSSSEGSGAAPRPSATANALDERIQSRGLLGTVMARPEVGALMGVIVVAVFFAASVWVGVFVALGVSLLGMHNLFACDSVQSGEGVGNEFLRIIGAVIGGCLLTGGFGSATGGWAP